MALEPISAQHVSRGLVGLIVEQSAQVRHRVFVHGKALDEMLVVNADAKPRVAAHLSIGRVYLAGDNFKDGTFT
jgi:hypothetical protein